MSTSRRDIALQAVLEAPTALVRLTARLRNKAAPQGACMFWIGAKDPDGYGVVQLCRGVTQRAARVVFAVANGRLPDGIVRHTCDQRACVNAAHLVEGTSAQNTQDMISRGRKASTAGERSATRKLSADDVLHIRAKYIPGQVTQKQLAEHYGVDVSQISHIVTKRNWSCL